MIPPVQIAGPILLALGILLVLIAIFASITTSQVFFIEFFVIINYFYDFHF
jgi:hypothetical protein